MWFLFAFLTAMGWAIGKIFLKPSYEKLSQSQVYFLNGIFFFLLWFIYLLFSNSSFQMPEGVFLFLPALPPLAFIFFIFALEKAEVSIIAAVTSTSCLVSSFLGVALLNEPLSSMQVFLIVFAVIGLILLGLVKKAETKSKQDIFSGFFWGSICSISFGIANTSNKFTINEIGPASFSIINASWMIIIGLIWLILSKSISLKKWEGIKSLQGKQGVLGSAIYSLAGFFLFLSLGSGPVSLVIPVTNLSVPITIFLARIFLKEKLTFKQIFLIILITFLTSVLVFF